MSNTTSLPKNKIKVLLLEGVDSSSVEAFHADGYTDLEYHKKSLPEAKLLQAVEDAHFIGIRSATHLTAQVFANAHKLIAVGCFCIGTNQVDLIAARDRGIPVFNAPFSNTRSVAELVLAEIIFLLRGIPRRNADAHRGGWAKTATGSHEVRGKVLGIIGYGHIGTQVGLLAEAVGMQVLFYDIESKLTLSNAKQVVSLAELLSSADVVTLHVPETPQTRNMIGVREISLMKKGAALINAARGTVVDIEALADALHSEHLSGAAVDVFPSEPKTGGEEFVSPLRGHENVILTPHIAGSTEEAQKNIGREVADKLIRYSNNGSTLTAVNFPEVSLPEHQRHHRIMHIHRNQPGMLSRINAVFSEAKVNVAAQYLQTNPAIGYVVIDVETPGPEESLSLRRMLDEIPGTIRTRVLY
ncbi:MAG: D-3-phosphoglycerate dehydrogenase [Bryobacterales bacterium]|nr:D-3-phosphoglycerate dehydrogenase [Bryobacterales bacterium]